jgi:arsenite methyltransferase
VSAGRDCWADWLLERRLPGDPDVERRWVAMLRAARDRVLDAAEVGPGQTLLDVGCGDGLIAFGALERGADTVIFSDISRDLLDESRRLAERLDVIDRCRFVVAAADALDELADESVDAVTTRSVLIYVDDKRRAFREFHRVLAPGGRVSLYEPVNRHIRLLEAYDVTGVRDVFDRVKAVFDTLQPRDKDPMMNFDEHDLVDAAEAAGFPRVELTLEVEIQPPEPTPWDVFVNVVGNPKIPSLGEAMEQVLSPAERNRLESHLRPLVENGRGSSRMAIAYLRAVKEAQSSSVTG